MLIWSSLIRSYCYICFFRTCIVAFIELQFPYFMEILVVVHGNFIPDWCLLLHCAAPWAYEVL